MLEVFTLVLESRPDSASMVKEYMDSLTAVPRFGTISLFMSGKEREAAKKVWSLLKLEPLSVWKKVM
jgi:hypothetical protein